MAREPEVREEQEENSLVVQEPEKEVNAQESEPLIPSNKLDVEVALHEKSKDEAESLFKLPEPEPEDINLEPLKTPRGIDFFINPPEEFLIKKRGVDVVKEIRRLRGYDE